MILGPIIDEVAAAQLALAGEQLRRQKTHEYLEACRDLVATFAGNHAYGQPCGARDEARALMERFSNVTGGPPDA